MADRLLAKKNALCIVGGARVLYALYGILYFSLFNLSFFTLESCHRRPLEVYWQDEARLILHVDWMSRFGMHPVAMTVHLYQDDGQLYRSFSTNDVDSVRLSLPVGRYRMIIFNGDQGSFSSFRFQDGESFNHFRTIARDNTSRAGNQPRWDAGMHYQWEPDERLGAAVDSFEVTQDMLDRQLKFIHYTKRDKAVGTLEIYHLYETVLPLQPMIHIRVHVNGMENMYRLEANLSGMADGCSMAHTWRNATECTVFYDIDKWGYTFDGDYSKHGWVSIDIPTWGEPRGQELQETRDSMQNTLRMNFTLRNLEERYFEFNVGHLIYYKDPQVIPDSLTKPDVLRHLYLEINREIPLLPDVPYERDIDAGFNAWVDPWEWGGDVDLGTF